jgi:type VI secretion system secreted protein Hcp
MAETVHLYLKANGQDIQGESAQTSLGRANSIECLYFEHAVQTSQAAGSGLATGRRTYDPIRVVKRIDKASVLLAKALVQNQVVEGAFKFFRPSPTGDGTTEQFYTVSFRQGRIASFQQVTPETFDPETAAYPELEEVTFVFHAIRWEYVKGGIAFEDSSSTPGGAARRARAAAKKKR